LAAIASGCSLVLMSVGLVMTTSRGAWVALATALVLAGLWIVSGWLGQRRARWRGWLYPALLVVTLALALGLGIAWPEGPVAGIEALPGENTANSRAALMRSASLLVGDYPLVGAGLDSFMMLHSTYAWLLHVGYTPHSHNLTLNVAIEQGLVGLLALVAAWVVFFVLAARAGLFSHRRTGEGALAAAALSLIVLLVHGLLDNALYTSGGVFLLFAPLAFAAPLSTGRSGVRRQWLVPGLVLVLVTLLGALVWRGPILSLFYSNLGAVHQSQAELSVYRWPEWPIQDAVRREVDLSRPVAEFERALAFNPRNAAANRRLGMIELSMGEYEGALAHLEAAYAVESGSMTTRQLYGEALIVNGRVDEGRALWAGVSNAHPQLDNRAWWYRHIGEAERAEWIEQAASDHP
jgi:hypothetical protein